MSRRYIVAELGPCTDTMEMMDSVLKMMDLTPSGDLIPREISDRLLAIADILCER